MPDVYDNKTRSAIMQKMRSKGNKSTELRLIGIFREQGITGWKRGYPVKGHPDFVFLGKRIAVFVDGCFWHGHDCRNTRPKENEVYWSKKREHNVAHDLEVTNAFKCRGWTVVRIWECELKKKNKDALTEKLNFLILPKSFNFSSVIDRNGVQTP
jgi:DNA mismatch endonuclease (patch repair protein)